MSNKREEYLKEIREIEGLHNAILLAINVHQKKSVVEFSLVTDTPYTQEAEEKAIKVGGRYVPDGFLSAVKIVKRTPDADIIRQKICEFVAEKFPAACAFLKEEDVEVEMLGSGAQFYFAVASGEQTLFTANSILDAVSAYLQTIFCGAFYGAVRIVEKQYDDAVLDEQPVVQQEVIVSDVRMFPIEDCVRIDSPMPAPKTAVYIADIASAQGAFSVCGKLTFIEEKQYVKHNEKTGEDVQKTRFSLAINDGTGTLRTTYFPKKVTLDRIRSLQAGDSIVLTGENEEYRGSMSFKAAKIDLGTPPKGFVPVQKASKPVPVSYHTVFPEKYVDYTQVDLFSRVVKTEDLSAHDFVVFDLETTGLIRQPSMGKMDKIIEVGAVKISGGEIVEKFSSFVACPDKLPANIVTLTGITDEDLVGAPPIKEVITDFFKFCDGCLLVGHNVNFDYDFVSYYAEQEGFYFTQQKYDTMTLAHEVLRAEGLANFKLNTIADYYSFTFQHHRAFDDALVTAKIFMELIKKRGKLPY